jgi:chromosome segregation ATPase
MNNKTIQEALKLLELEIKSLEKEIKNKNNKITKLKNFIKDLKKYNSSEKYKELYEKEKERLIKLHTYYTQIQKDRQKLKTKVENWEKWFSLNKQILNKLFSNAPPEGFFTNDKKPVNKKIIVTKKK